MKYFLFSVLLSAVFTITAAEKKESSTQTPEPAKVSDSKSVLNVWAEKSGKTYRKVKRKTIRAFDFTGSHTIRTSIESARNDQTAKAYAAGQYMAKHFAGKKVALLLSSPVDSDDNKKFIEAFEKVTAGKVQTIIIPVGSEKDNLPLPDNEPTVEALNKALLQSIADGADALVNLAGLPVRNSHCSKLLFWQWGSNDPRVYLADAPDTTLLKEKLFPCPFAVVVVPRLLTEDELAEATGFNARYIELTEKNLKSSGILIGK